MTLSRRDAIALLAAACGPLAQAPEAGPAQPLSAAALDSVRAVDAAFAAGISARDTAAVFAVYAADAKLMLHDSPTRRHPGVHRPCADGGTLKRS